MQWPSPKQFPLGEYFGFVTNDGDFPQFPISSKYQKITSQNIMWKCDLNVKNQRSIVTILYRKMGGGGVILKEHFSKINQYFLKVPSIPLNLASLTVSIDLVLTLFTLLKEVCFSNYWMTGSIFNGSFKTKHKFLDFTFKKIGLVG